MSLQLLTREMESVLETDEQPMVVDFYADWCMPCRMQGPQFQQAEALLQGQAQFYKVDIDQQPELAARFEVRSIPTIVIVLGGETRWRSVGVTSKDEIVAAVQQVLLEQKP